jgi:hypothetical protein
MDHESLLIINSGASVYITPHRLDFITYKMSNMKIKDLSSSNTVAGEGLLRWKVEDCAGRVVNLDLPGYHIPGAEVCLLSPQVILLVFGGHTTQTTQKIEVCSANGLVLDAHLFPRSCLPLLPFVPGGSKLSSFWTYAFAYSANDVVQAKTILGSANNNLSSSQKELLLWHQRLSHANLAWIQTLMRDRKWLEGSSSMASLHSGPFIVSLSRAPTCDVWGLKCLAYLCAKAHTCTTKNKSTTLQPEKKQVLKRRHLVPGHCVSVDYYMSSVVGRLPHTFGQEWVRYSCGTLFVDHASGKLFIFVNILLLLQPRMPTGIHCLVGGDNHSRISCRQWYLCFQSIQGGL